MGTTGKDHKILAIIMYVPQYTGQNLESRVMQCYYRNDDTTIPLPSKHAQICPK